MAADQKRRRTDERSIYRIWPDFPVSPMLDRSAATVKADAARRSYEASGADVTWAVIDSGIQGDHPHFTCAETLAEDVKGLHRDFTRPNDPIESALIDELGHGSHVAGVIAGGYLADHGLSPPLVGQHVSRRDAA